jgi:hypothetical protein
LPLAAPLDEFVGAVIFGKYEFEKGSAFLPEPEPYQFPNRLKGAGALFILSNKIL